MIPRFGKQNPAWKGGKPKCKVCGKKLSRYFGTKKYQHCRLHRINPPRTEVAKENMRRAKRGKHVGASNPNWKGGVKQFPYLLTRKRRMAKAANGGFHTLTEWETLKAQHNWTCCACRKREPEIILHRDHIVPVSKGGSDNIENIQPLCRYCNSKKGTRLISFIEA